MKKYGHNLKPLQAEIKCLGTAYGENEEIIRKIQNRLSKDVD
jgi:hypothetical protein